MQSATYYVLAALVGEPLHGYAVAKRVQTLSEGSVTLTAGTLYGALDRLVDRGLLTVDRMETVNGRNRRYYRLEDDGLAALVAETEARRSAVRMVDTLLAAPTPKAAP